MEEVQTAASQSCQEDEAVWNEQGSMNRQGEALCSCDKWEMADRKHSVWIFGMQKGFKHCNVKHSNTCKEAQSYQLLGKAEVGPQNPPGWNGAAWASRMGLTTTHTVLSFQVLRATERVFWKHISEHTYSLTGCSWYPLHPLEQPSFQKAATKRLPNF